jgi:hypothetical protein
VNLGLFEKYADRMSSLTSRDAERDPLPAFPPQLPAPHRNLLRSLRLDQPRCQGPHRWDHAGLLFNAIALGSPPRLSAKRGDNDTNSHRALQAHGGTAVVPHGGLNILALENRTISGGSQSATGPLKNPIRNIIFGLTL